MMDWKAIVGRVYRAESDKQKRYQEFFEKKLKEHGVSSPSELSDDEKKKFFEEVDKEWTGEKEASRVASGSINQAKLGKAILAYCEMLLGDVNEGFADLIVLKNAEIISFDDEDTFGTQVTVEALSDAIPSWTLKVLRGKGKFSRQFAVNLALAFRGFLHDPVNNLPGLKVEAKKWSFKPVEGVDVEDVKTELFAKLKKAIKQVV